MASDDKQYKAAMANLDKLLKKQELLNKSSEALKNSWGAISQEVFKLSGAEWFKKVPLAAEDIEKLNQKLDETNKEINNIEKAFNKALDQEESYKKLEKSSKKMFGTWEASLKGIDQTSNEYTTKRMSADKSLADQMRKTHSQFASMQDEDLIKIAKHMAAGGKLSDAYDDLSDSAQNLLLANTKNGGELLKAKKNVVDLKAAQAGYTEELAKGTKEVFSLSKGLQGISKNIMTSGIDSLKAFDQELTNVQRSTGIMMRENSQAFGQITGEVAQFGMSVQQAGAMMGEMADELNTTNFSVLSKATKDFAAIEGATGASSKEITTISGQLMRMGKSSEAVKDYFQGASQMAQKFGVSSKKAIEGISRNIGKMRSMGFVGGEKSLAKMVVTAEKLNMNVDEIFDVAKKARSIEGAMEMASELQLAGGSFANINPMDLLAAARKGPEELQKILTGMGKDIGRFNKESGEYEFDPVDVDRLQMVADATGQSLDSIMNGIQKSGQDAEKLKPFAGMLDGMSEADKALAESSLSDMMKYDKESGKMVIDADNDLAKKMGIDSLEDINGDMITKMNKQANEDAKTLDEQNKRNQSFQESLTNFWGALQSIFTVFEPVLQFLTGALQGAAKIFGMLPGWGKYLVGGLIIAFGLFGTSVGAFITQGVGKFLGGVKDMGKSVMGMFKGGGMAGLGAKIKEKFTPGASKTGDIASSKVEGPKGKPGDGLKSLADGLKAMGSDNSIFKGILAVALAGPAFLLFAPALPGLLVMGLIGSMGKSVTAGFEAISKGLVSFGSDKNVFMGILAVAAAAIPLLIFTLALPGMLAMALVGVLAVPIAAGFKAISTGLSTLGGNLVNVLKGSLAMLVIGAAMIPFVYALSIMGGIDWMSVLIGVGMMALIMIGLIGLGAMLMSPAGLFLVLGIAALIGVGLGLMIFGASMMVFAAASQMMQGMDFSWLASLGTALLTAAPGLLLGGLGLLVATPGLVFGSLGIMAMATALQTAASVDWNIIANMGNALLSAVPGLLAFGLSSIMFTSPIIMFGMISMILMLGALAAVMTPLAQALTLGSQSLGSFAEGLERLSTAADSLSDEKLAKLQKISEAMAIASIAGNVANAAANTAQAAGGAGGGKSEPIQVQVDLMLNGQQIQSILASNKVGGVQK